MESASQTPATASVLAPPLMKNAANGVTADGEGEKNGGSAEPVQGNGSPMTLDPSVWAGFYKKTIKTRQDQLHLLFPRLEKPQDLPMNVADNMIENCIGTVSLPLGLGLNFKINGKDIVIPMAVEEPSVVAAVSGAAKTVAEAGGFTTTYSGNIMVSQIQIMDVSDPDAAVAKILANKTELMQYGNVFCRTMVRRGGGMRDITVRILPIDRRTIFAVYAPSATPSAVPKIIDEPISQPKEDRMLVVHLHVDVCESMGANTVNTIAEGLAPHVLELVGGRVGLKIVTNFCTERRASAMFRVPLSQLGYKKLKGDEMARGILEAYAFAASDPYRAVTHNKGVMNGVDAAAVALGQDWRAIEAGAHAWASRNGPYRPLTSYRVVKDANGVVSLEGAIELPVPVGVRGGAIQTHPMMKYTHTLLGNLNCAGVGEALAAVGLAQNFAAVRALASEGIQRGHMALHSRNMAIQAGAPPELVPEVTAYMVARGKISVESARDYLSAHSILTEGTQHRFERKRVPPSTLIVELDLEVPISINVVFESLTPEEKHLIIKENRKFDPVQNELFGEGRGSDWFKQIFSLLGLLRAHKAPQRSNLLLQNQLKLTSMLMNLLAYRLMELHPKETARFLNGILTAALNPLNWLKKRTESAILIGFPLLDSLWSSFKNAVDQSVSVKPLSNALKEEQLRIFAACATTPDSQQADSFEEFMRTHGRRFQVTIFLLCDLQSIAPNLITAATLHFFFRLGHYLEWEGTIANDLGNAKRALTTGENNSYTFWLKLTGKKHDENTIEQFLNETVQLNQRLREKLLRDRETVPYFDVTNFLENIPVVQRYYAISEIMRVAKL